MMGQLSTPIDNLGQTYSWLLETTGGKERIRHYVAMLGLTESSLSVAVDELHIRKNEIFHEGIRSGDLVLRPGVENILEEASIKGIRLAMATTTSMSNIEALFASGILRREQWEVIAAGDMVEKKKPASDVYVEALKGLGLEAMQCLALEDSENGLRAAMAAGIPTVIVTNPYTRHQNFHGAITVCEGLSGNSMVIGTTHLEAWYASTTSVQSDTL